MYKETLVRNRRVDEEARTKLVTLSIDALNLRLVVASSKHQILQRVTTTYQGHILDAIPVVTVDEECSLSTGVAEGVADIGLRMVRKGGDAGFVGVPCSGMARHRSYKETVS